jgi:hypothetical protein
MDELIQMGIDLYNNKITKYSQDEANEAFRKALLELCGGKVDYKSFRRNKIAIFEVMEETLDALVSAILEDQFNQFAEVKNLAWGDTNTFIIDNTDLFEVATISDGNGNLRRQRLDNGSLTVTTYMEGVKIYDELYRFLAGRIDWVKMVNKVARSYNNKIATKVYEAIYNSFSSLGTTYGISGAFSEDSFIDLVSHVSAAAGGLDVAVYGVKKALAKVAPATVSDTMKDEKGRIGFYRNVDGVNLFEIPQAHKAGTDTFAIASDFLLVVPVGGESIVKIVIEGDALIDETPGNNGRNADDTMEYTFRKKCGVAVVTPNKYGIYKVA